MQPPREVLVDSQEFIPFEEASFKWKSEALAELARPCGRFKSVLSLEKTLTIKLADSIENSDLLGGASLIFSKGIPANWQALLNYLHKKEIIAEPRFYVKKFSSDRPKVNSARLQPCDSFDKTDGRKVDPYGFGSARTLEEAMSKAVGEVLERYFLTLYRREAFSTFSRASLLEWKKNFFDPAALNSFLPWQKEMLPDLVWDDNTPFCFVKGEELIGKKTAYIPAQLVFWNYQFGHREPLLIGPTTSGAAGHFTKNEAFLASLLENIERDGFFIYWLNSLSPNVIDVSLVEDEEAKELLAYIERYHLEVFFLNTTTDIGIPSCVCAVIDRTCDEPVISLGGAAGFIRSTMVGGSDGGLGSSIVATHGFINNPSLDEIWVRQYIRFGAGYTWNNNQKFTSGQGYPFNPGGGGIAYYGIGHDTRVMQLCPVQSCNNLNEGYLGHNQTPITMTTDRWYYMEYHVILNTVDVRNGTWELWINDCGTSGVCTGSPTLRARYTNVLYLGTGFGMYIGKIGGFFLDIWGNPSDGGNLDVDQIIVSNNGTTGFMGSTPPPTDTTSPTVSVTAPANGSTVSGTVTVSANASDNTGVSGVQFLLDGTNLGAEDTTSPYAVSWNTTTATNGSHTLTARARDAAGNTTTSSSVTVTVSNALVGDLNGDRTVNSLDWTMMANVWFTNDAVADINKDSIVNSIDFSLLNQNWGRSQ